MGYVSVRTQEAKKGVRCLPGPVLDLYPAASWGASLEREPELVGWTAVLYDYDREWHWQLHRWRRWLKTWWVSAGRLRA